MTFTRQQITEAKKGSHFFALGPLHAVREWVVVKVRHDEVFVTTKYGVHCPMPINPTCSKKLIDGEYRTP